MTRLVIQLVGRIPNAELDRDVVKMQVDAFKKKIEPLLEAKSTDLQTKEEVGEASVAKIFEEIKVMFQDLPGRIQRRTDPEYAAEVRRRHRLNPRFIDEIANAISKDFGDPIVLLVVSSFFKDDFPWLYELAVDTYRKLEAHSPEGSDALKRLMRITEISVHHPAFREISRISGPRRFEREETMMFFMHIMERTLSLVRGTPVVDLDTVKVGSA